MCWASAPGTSSAIVATTWRGRSVCSSAHSATAPRLRSQPSRAARRTSSSGASAGARAQVLEERAAQVLLDLVARLLDGDLGQRGDRREVQVLRGLARSARSRPRAAARSRPSRRPRRSGSRSPGRAAGATGGRRRSRRRSGAARAAARPAACPAAPCTAAPSRGTTIATVPPTASAASSATRSRPSPARTASTIRRCSPLSRSTRVAAVGAATLTAPSRPPRRRRPGGPAASPHRIRRCGSGRPPRRGGRTPSRRRRPRCARA